MVSCLDFSENNLSLLLLDWIMVLVRVVDFTQLSEGLIDLCFAGLLWKEITR